MLISPLYVGAYSQNSVVNIDKTHFNIDINKKIILINKDVEELNSFYSELKINISSNDDKFTLATPVPEFKIGAAYKVSDIHNEVYDLYFTQLPIINISTEHTIIDEPRVYAHFSICETNGNYITHNIGIEYRGGWTQSLPKKSLRIEFWNDTQGNMTENISLLGMRSDDDWNLEAMYNEPLRLRSKISHDLWRKIDQLYYIKNEPKAINGVHQKYVELFVNEEYRGVYTLSERVDRKQLKLKKYKNEKIRGELYKGIGWGASTFSSLPHYNNRNELWGGFEYKHPKEEIDWSNIYEFVDFVINEDSISFYQNYQNRFCLDNAVNYFIFVNLLRATDNKGKNLFIARYNVDEPYFYVPWDLDGTFGIIWNGTKENISDDILTNGFYRRLLSDNKKNGFIDKLKNRWNELRINTITLDNIVDEFNTQFDYLNINGVYERELRAWQGGFFDYDNIEYTYGWIENRLNYLDNKFNSLKVTTNIKDHNGKVEIQIYPNPASSFIYINLLDDNYAIKNISIIDILGQASTLTISNMNHKKIDISNLADGIYLIIAEFNNGYKQVEKLIIRK